MSEEQASALEELVSLYSYILMRIEFFEAAMAWLCIHDGMSIHDSSNDIQLAHSCLYTGLWVETQPADDAWPVHIFMSKKAEGWN